MRVLAIDPGFDRMGIAVVEGDASKPVHVWSDCIIPPKGEKGFRLAHIKRAVEEAVIEYEPDLLALETLFFAKNVSTALGVAEARGAVLAVAGAEELPVREYAPSTIKLSVTGHGASDKRAVAKMLPLLMKLPEKKRFDDELDALALGITALADRYPHA